MQILKKNWLVVWKKTRNIANFHQSTWQCQNWTFDGILLSKVEEVYMTLKFTEELCVMKIKSNGKFEEKFDFLFQN